MLRGLSCRTSCRTAPFATVKAPGVPSAPGVEDRLMARTAAWGGYALSSDSANRGVAQQGQSACFGSIQRLALCDSIVLILVTKNVDRKVMRPPPNTESHGLGLSP